MLTLKKACKASTSEIIIDLKVPIRSKKIVEVSEDISNLSAISDLEAGLDTTQT